MSTCHTVNIVRKCIFLLRSYIYAKMVRGVATNQKVRQIIVQQFCKGKAIRQISRDLVIPTSTVSDIVKKYGETATTDIRGKSPGRPRIVTVRNQRALVKICKSGRRNTVRHITTQWNTECGIKVSRECCRKYIHKSGLKFYKVCIITLLFQKNYFFFTN